MGLRLSKRLLPVLYTYHINNKIVTSAVAVTTMILRQWYSLWHGKHISISKCIWAETWQLSRIFIDQHWWKLIIHYALYYLAHMVQVFYRVLTDTFKMDIDKEECTERKANVDSRAQIYQTWHRWSNWMLSLKRRETRITVLYHFTHIGERLKSFFETSDRV